MSTLILAGTDLLLIARYFNILTLKNTRHDKLIKLCFNKNINYPQKLIIVTYSTLPFKNISFADGYKKKKKKKNREKLKIS